MANPALEISEGDQRKTRLGRTWRGIGNMNVPEKSARSPRCVCFQGSRQTGIQRVGTAAYGPLRTLSFYPEADAGQPTSVVGHQRAFLLAMRPSRSSAL